MTGLEEAKEEEAKEEGAALQCNVWQEGSLDSKAGSAFIGWPLRNCSCAVVAEIRGSVYG